MLTMIIMHWQIQKKSGGITSKMKEKFSTITIDPPTHMHMKESFLAITHSYIINL